MGKVEKLPLFLDQGLAALFADLTFYLLATVGLNIGNGYPRTFGSEQPRGRCSHSRRRAANPSNLPRQTILVHDAILDRNEVGKGNDVAL